MKCKVCKLDVRKARWYEVFLAHPIPYFFQLRGKEYYVHDTISPYYVSCGLVFLTKQMIE